MDYETFYSEYAVVGERLKAQLAQQQRLLKRINRSMDTGDIKGAGKDIDSLSAASLESADTIREIAAVHDGVDMSLYLESGDFASQLVEACKSRGIDIIGEGNNYEIFPYRLKITAAEEEVLINGKKAPGLRPAAVADFLEKGRAKLLAANFNADKFAAELAAVYDIAVVSGSRGKKSAPDADVYLNTLYKYLVPMARFRRDYGAQSFAFDIARLYSTENVVLSDGRKIQFGPSRNNNRAVRILDAQGREFFIATVRFYKE
jgi:hypothetical protein